MNQNIHGVSAANLQERLGRARQLIASRNQASVAPPAAGNVDPHLAVGWDNHPRFRNLQSRKKALVQAGLHHRYFQPRESISADVIRVSGSELLNFSGYNYLGLAGHPEVLAAAKKAIDDYGTSVSASRLASGEIPLHGQLEQELASVLGTQACLVFSSGYGTNVSTISHLFGAKDLLVHDALIHNSVIAGCQLSGGRRLSFRHNDMDALERLLTEHRSNYEQAIIIVEAVYSMDGDITPLSQVIEIKKRHNALVMIDEAHSLGVLGPRGFGIGEHWQIDPAHVDIWMGTLSKTLASCGGYIAGSEALIELLRYDAPGFTYSCGLSPANTAASLAALRVMCREPTRVERLRQRASQFLCSAYARDLDTGTSSGSAIVPVIVGDSMRAMRLAEHLFGKGINVHPITYPVVEDKRARLRFLLTALHTSEQVEKAIDAVAAVSESLRTS
jgi:8-amino-7-oxononanoate synthase